MCVMANNPYGREDISGELEQARKKYNSWSEGPCMPYKKIDLTVQISISNPSYMGKEADSWNLKSHWKWEGDSQ